MPPSFNAITGLVLLLSAVGVGLMSLSEEVASVIRSRLRDFAAPGQFVVGRGVELLADTLHGIRESRASHLQFAKIESQLRASELRNRILQARQVQFKLEHPSPFMNSTSQLQGEQSQPLMHPELIEARVLGQETTALWRGRKFLGSGRAQGLEESLLVLEGTKTTLDQGTSTHLSPSDPVCDGRIVIGRISNVGTWTSSLELITDAKFSNLACILRETDEGWVAGPEGILKGDGREHCRMEIKSEEPVEIGDTVWTVPDDGVFPFPMKYGRVIKVALKPGALHWELQIEPALKDVRLRTVYVRRTKLNPARLLGN